MTVRMGVFFVDGRLILLGGKTHHLLTRAQ